MSKHLFSFPFLQQLSKPSTWLFILATILLHIFLLESAAWKEWTPKPTLENLPPISVSLRTASEQQKPVEEAVAISPKKTKLPARATIAQATQEPVATTKLDEITAPIKDPSVDETPESKTEPVIDTKATPVTNSEESSVALPEFKLRVPLSAEMQLAISHTKVNGNPTTGVGSLTWDFYNGKYRLSIEAGINLLITNLNLLTITSEGHVDLYGLMPVISNDIRRSRAATSIHFNHTDKTILFSATNKVIPMENGAQDAVSVLIQLAAIGYADASQLSAGKELTIQVAEGRDASAFLFRVMGEEEIDSQLSTETGKLMTVHISRPPKPGFYNSQLDIWLAPSLGWYPVQIRNTESNGSVTNQVVVALKQKINLVN